MKREEETEEGGGGGRRVTAQKGCLGSQVVCSGRSSSGFCLSSREEGWSVKQGWPWREGTGKASVCGAFS